MKMPKKSHFAANDMEMTWKVSEKSVNFAPEIRNPESSYCNVNLRFRV